MIKFSIFISISLCLFEYRQGLPSNSVIQTYSMPKWNSSSYAKNGINDNCRFISNKCTGTCLVTNKPCQVLYNFDEPVCGCNYCFYNTLTKQCNGICHNTMLQTCVSKRPIPKKNSDCACASCLSSWVTIKTTTGLYNYPSELYTGEKIPSCDESSCYPGNSCSFFYVSKNRRVVNDTLFCACNNNNF
jgi:hypothetical protein